ncbi:MAG: dihydropteroate synthase [Synergistaceae bacterium]|nr:dihydropteroate synthase [Synergistaceae bacterium]
MLSVYTVYPVKISGVEDMLRVCEKIGADSHALAYLSPKSKINHIYVERVDYRAANFLKQEMLSRGGDVAVAKHVIDGKTDYSDILIMGTDKQLSNLIEKMKSMTIWGIGELREKLLEVIRNVKAGKWEMTSPNGRKIILDDKTRLMAILNLTPDSFFAGSRIDESGIIERAERFLVEGAYILDVGAESTRPGASPVSESEEIQRLVPSLRLLRREFPDALISVDTYKAGTARISVEEGADIINDISGAAFDPDMAGAVTSLKIPYILSHINGTPEGMADKECGDEILSELNRYFAGKLDIFSELRENVIIDPGLGFGKSSADNFEILKNIESLKVFGRPLMIGHSRKRFTGGIAGTIGVSALMSGKVSLMRVHDVSENMKAVEIGKYISHSRELPQDNSHQAD